MPRHPFTTALAAFGLATIATAQDKPAQKASLGRHAGARQDARHRLHHDEGTWMSADISPTAVDRLRPARSRLSDAGRRRRGRGLTQNSGVALNFQPRISPDGKLIAFISDRRGQYNLWVMNADGSNPRAVFTDPSVTAASRRGRRTASTSSSSARDRAELVRAGSGCTTRTAAPESSSCRPRASPAGGPHLRLMGATSTSKSRLMR